MFKPILRPAAALLALSLVAAKQTPGPPIYDPDPTQPGAGKLAGETWSKESPAAAVWLTRIDAETRTRFVKRRSGLAADPFTAAPGREETAFMAFHVLVENRTDARVVFEPQSCRLKTGWMDFQEPLDLPTIMALYGMADRMPPEGIEKIRSAIIDEEVVLRPGEKRDGLLVFHAIDPQIKTYQIEAAVTLSKGDAFGLTAYYKKRKK